MYDRILVSTSTLKCFTSFGLDDVTCQWYAFPYDVTISDQIRHMVSIIQMCGHHVYGYALFIELYALPLLRYSRVEGGDARATIIASVLKTDNTQSVNILDLTKLINSANERLPAPTLGTPLEKSLLPNRCRDERGSKCR